MSLSPENRALIERAYPDYVPEQIRDAGGLLNCLLDAARAGGRTALPVNETKHVTSEAEGER